MGKIVDIKDNIVTVEFYDGNKNQYLIDNFLQTPSLNDMVILNKKGFFVNLNVIEGKKNKKIIIKIVVFTLLIVFVLLLLFSLFEAGSEIGRSCGNSCNEVGDSSCD